MLMTHLIFGQKQLELPIDLNLKNVTIENVLDKIEEKTKIEFSYSKSLLPETKIATFKKRNTIVELVLDDLLLSRNLGYKIIGEQVVIFKNKVLEKTPTYTLSGYVEDANTGERLIGATVIEINSQQGTSSNRYGFYSLTLKEKVPQIYVSYLGYNSFVWAKNKPQTEFFSIKLKPNLTLGEVVVNSSEFEESKKLRALEIDLKEMDLLPALLGETDLLRTINSLPGVQSGAEGIGGLHVRGGNFDQNLILLDDAPIYNPIHTWGFYSIFNSSAIQRSRVFKSGFPARYGGRLSSVIDVQTKDGNKQKREHELELGVLSAKASTEGPIIKDKASYFLSFRRSLTDVVNVVPYDSLFDGREGAIDPKLNYFFYDVNAKINYAPDKKNRFQLSFYQGRDDFEDSFKSSDLLGDTSIVNFSSRVLQDWGNRVATFRWNRTLSEKLFANLTATYSRYDYQSRSTRKNELEENGLIESGLAGYNSNIQDRSLKIDFDYYHSPNRTNRFGARFTEYLFQPGIFNELIQLDDPTDTDSLQQVLNTNWQASEMRPLEFSIYAEQESKMWKNGIVAFGFSSSVFIGENKNWYSFDPRIRLEWNQNANLSFGGDIQRITQFTHLISPNRLGLPNDIWVSSTDQVAPQIANQASAWIRGKPFRGAKIGVEGYWKEMFNLKEFLAEKSAVLNAEDWENEVVTGSGIAYGVEVEWKQDFKYFESNINYTYAFSDRLFDGINGDTAFRFRYDRRHVINASFFKKINKKWNVSASFVFGTDLATTLPVGTYTFPRFGFPIAIEVIGARNQNSIPEFHHLDFGADYSWKRSQIKFGIHNVYFRNNVLLFEFGREEANKSPLKQRALPPILPAISYKMKI